MRALVSVSDKSNLVEFVQNLVELGYEIVSTGGTKKALDDAKIPTIGISEVTDFPEMLDGRVKTLHPNIHGGLLAIRDNDNHVEALKKYNIDFIDLVCVNLYPFKSTIEKGCTFEEAVEQIDIGGPSMLRSAAKNHRFVTVVSDTDDYNLVIEEIKKYGNTLPETRLNLAAKVFNHTAFYDTVISNYLLQSATITPKYKNVSFELESSLRYGENPHQDASLYRGVSSSYSVVDAKQLQGKELSYNNINDANACLNILKEFDEPTAVGLKHMNPCGVSSSSDILTAWENAYNADSTSIFGGIVAFNRVVTAELAKNMKDKKVFLEIIMAPGYEESALTILKSRKNCRVLEIDITSAFTQSEVFSTINGGLLLQNTDNQLCDELVTVTDNKPTDSELEDLLFAMKVCKHVKSNAIVVAKNKTTCGVGAGQMNRVGSAKLALEWAKLNGSDNLVLASDAFFPFDDTVRLAKEYNVTSIIQPGGSVRDEDSVNACNELGISMVMSKIRHFKH